MAKSWIFQTNSKGEGHDRGAECARNMLVEETPD
jgi:hypothetical protein